MKHRYHAVYTLIRLNSYVVHPSLLHFHHEWPTGCSPVAVVMASNRRTTNLDQLTAKTAGHGEASLETHKTQFTCVFVFGQH